MLQLEGASRVRVGPDGPPAPAAARRWLIAPVHSGGGIFHVVSADNERRLDVANASTESGARVQVWRANAFGAQEWIVEEHLDAPGAVSLIACISGLPLEADAEGRVRQGGTPTPPHSGGGWSRRERRPGRAVRSVRSSAGGTSAPGAGCPGRAAAPAGPPAPRR
ncbi:RICIN domain-containing protein [Streptomyces sp. PCS3-D2]|uniref:RICIN domain-containing protein n=1 Tax=Streptomyces sp. PCS3-D2 TaxID=1460244 RepID=UPI00351A2996